MLLTSALCQTVTGFESDSDSNGIAGSLMEGRKLNSAAAGAGCWLGPPTGRVYNTVLSEDLNDDAHLSGIINPGHGNPSH